ncbi:hypothetical protein BN77_p260015 [Rhizobium mesoamericanum STM3625]|uniref:Uncharacterized protein n=1 Tax=Rhizobium mesoamericanum STM3625 TaxID=1211777 RepID=K0Q1M3_9HYPH|nr:hypothetical protein BN77_p260015 [Rhizobium mesoamericanum STM3625]
MAIDDGDLAVVLLAELAAILPRDPDRMLALPGKASVIDNPRFNRPMPLDQRQHQIAQAWPITSTRLST